MFITDFLKVFVPLFVVLDPFGSLVIYISLTGEMNPAERRVVTKDAVLYGFLILIFFAIFGNYILYFFGISIEALEIGGGLILLIMGIQMVREGDKPKSAGGQEKDIGIVPFATPLIAGPGAISLVIILMYDGFSFVIYTLVSLLIIFGILYLFLTHSEKIFEVFGGKGLKAVTRIFGLLLTAFAVQYFLNSFVQLGVLAFSGL
ncbi:MAG: MarC family protein [Candidatus Thermoplasmatota archaeon]|nr:MarC family protein [Candidatus Thermoplasmatota archaeon]